MSRFFDPESPVMRRLALLFDFFILSTVSGLCALPILTAGASAAALYGAAAELAAGRSAGLPLFFRLFRQCLPKASAAWVMMLAAGGLLAADLWIAGAMPPVPRLIMRAGLFFLFLCLLLISVFFFPMLSTDPTPSLLQLFHAAFFASVAHLPRAAGMVLIAMLPLLILLFTPRLFFYMGFFWFFFWAAIVMYLWAKLSDTIICPNRRRG